MGARNSAPTDQQPTVYLNDPRANGAAHFPTNYFRTTKYTVLTFLPLNLFQQFHRWANFYFLLSAVISCIPNVSPVSWYTSVFPLLFVLGVSAIKEAVEDFRRYKEDVLVNNIKFQVLRNGTLVDVPSRLIECGDILRVRGDEMLPADCIVLRTSLPEGQCYVNTANLDGETNLKLRKATATTMEREPAALKGWVHCDAPNPALYSFTGVMKLDVAAGSSLRMVRLAEEAADGSIPMADVSASSRRSTRLTITESSTSLSEKQLLLRGAILKNTEWAFCLAIYTGSHSKMFLNLKRGSNKMSHLERMLNRMILVIFLAHVTCVATAAGLSAMFDGSLLSASWYLGLTSGAAAAGGSALLTFLVLLSTMIPISLYVSVEVVRVAQMLFMQWDLQMVSRRGGGDEDAEPLVVRNSNVNEELGQVSFVFTDKTGTLTQNVMRFHSCSIAGAVYDESAGQRQLKRNVLAGVQDANAIREFLLALASCHAAIPNRHGERLVYESQSPDEVALVDAARSNGVTLLARQADGGVDVLSLDVFGEPVKLRVLETLAFTSARKCMSVLVQLPDGSLVLWVKGADDVLMAKCKASTPLYAATNEHLRFFSKRGLRTLVVAARSISAAEAEAWRAAYKEATEVVGETRDLLVSRACDAIERDLRLVGCSAVEDRLQDEVPETLQYLLEAGITVWMLTGDKRETAVNIAINSRLIPEDCSHITLAAETPGDARTVVADALQEFVQTGKIRSRKYALVVDGATLGHIRKANVSDDFYTLMSHCRSVVCCRTTPIQKAQVVRLIKQRTDRVCLSIGDGANDVSMIKEAHVGVGVVGREGNQASRSADYSIGEFKMLRRLLSVHGRYSYLRLSSFVQYFLYKNIAFTMCQMWFAAFSAFSGQTLYDEWLIVLYNIVFTGLPPLILGMFEKDVSERTLAENPQLFRRNQRSPDLNARTFVVWMLDGVFHSLAIFFVPYFMVGQDVIGSVGHSFGLATFGLLCSTICVFVVNLRIALLTRYWTWLTHFAIWGSIVVYLLFLVPYNALLFDFSSSFYGVFFNLAQTPMFYLTAVLVIVICLLPDVVCKYWLRMYHPDHWQVFQELDVERKAAARSSSQLRRKHGSAAEPSLLPQAPL